jgi:hypothetical protein
MASSSSTMGFNGEWHPLLMAHYCHQLDRILNKKPQQTLRESGKNDIQN